MIILNITKDWVINYIKNYGTDIVIPKEAEVIKTLAFNSFYLENDFEEGFFDESAYIIEKYQVRKVSLVDPQKKPYITVSFQAPVVGITIEKSGDKRCGYFLQRALLYLQEQLQFLQK